MASTIYIDLFLDDIRSSARSNVIAVGNALASCYASDHIWARFSVYQRGGPNWREDILERHSLSNQIASRLVSEFDDNLAYIISAESPPQVIVPNDDACHGDFVTFGCNAEDAAGYRPPEGEERLLQQVTLTIEPLAAFCRPTDQRLSNAVEQNLSQLEKLAFALIDELTPVRLVIRIDNVIPLPINCHFAYFRSVDEVIKDILLLNWCWYHGIKSYTPAMPPLCSRELGYFPYYFGSLRNFDQQERIWSGLEQWLKYSAIASSDHVRDVLKTKKFDQYNLRAVTNEAFCVLDWPYFLNRYIDDFYIEVLKAAAQE